MFIAVQGSIGPGDIKQKQVPCANTKCDSFLEWLNLDQIWLDHKHWVPFEGGGGGRHVTQLHRRVFLKSLRRSLAS